MQMDRGSVVTVLTLLYNYEEYGDEVRVHGGRIVCIVAGRKKKVPRYCGRRTGGRAWRITGYAHTVRAT